jgi:hypothetical protein
MSFRSGPGNSSNGDSTNSTTPTATNIPTIESSDEIQLIDKLDKGKSKELLTSPSLENLNEQAETAFRSPTMETEHSKYFQVTPESLTEINKSGSNVASRSGTSTPSSISSTETIKPSYPLDIKTDSTKIDDATSLISKFKTS